MHTGVRMKPFSRLRSGLALHAVAAAATILAAAATVTVRAQSPRPMSAVDLLNLPRLGDPQLSPDGRDVVFTRAQADWKSGRRVTHIWRARVGGEPVQLTNGSENESGPRWSPDG